MIGALAAGLLVSACQQPEDAVERPAGEVSDAIAVAVSSITRNVTPGKHLGFDTYAYPGDEAMLAWRDDSVPYEWVGYYLPAPCHRETSWSGKRDRLSKMGWGMAVIYVGQQTWGQTPGRKVTRTKYVTRQVKQRVKRNGKWTTRRVKKRVPVKVVVQPRARQGSTCSTQLVSGARGKIDGEDAIRRTVAEGFGPGTVIFLDIERMETVPERMRDYYRAWTRAVLADGRFAPGYYTHSKNADRIHRDVKPLFVDAGIRTEPQFWVAGGRGFTEDSEPHEVGHTFAKVWQGILDVQRTYNGIELPVDVNVSHVPSPSAGVRAE